AAPSGARCGSPPPVRLDDVQTTQGGFSVAAITPGLGRARGAARLDAGRAPGLGRKSDEAGCRPRLPGRRAAPLPAADVVLATADGRTGDPQLRPGARGDGRLGHPAGRHALAHASTRGAPPRTAPAPPPRLALHPPL